MFTSFPHLWHFINDQNNKKEAIRGKVRLWNSGSSLLENIGLKRLSFSCLHLDLISTKLREVSSKSWIDTENTIYLKTSAL